MQCLGAYCQLTDIIRACVFSKWLTPDSITQRSNSAACRNIGVTASAAIHTKYPRVCLHHEPHQPSTKPLTETMSETTKGTGRHQDSKSLGFYHPSPGAWLHLVSLLIRIFAFRAGTSLVPGSRAYNYCCCCHLLAHSIRMFGDN